MPQEDTVILLTPPGAAAIAVVRLAGSGTREFLANHFSKSAPPNRCVHGLLRDARGAVLDDPVVVVSENGRVADLNVHGGAWVVQSVLNLAELRGFQLAGADAFSLDGEDEIEREVLQNVPAARTKLALQILLAQPRAWADLIRNPVRITLEGMLTDFSLKRLLHPPTVAIVGAPNVGKSTLANQLFAQERSITADLPGTTRDWVGEIANIDGLAITLVDTPGVREASDAIERTAIERSGALVQRADLVLLVLDTSMPLVPDQQPMIDAHPEAMKVINKIDRPAKWNIDAPSTLRIVASSGQGIDQLREAIQRHFGCADLSITQPRIWTARQRSLVAAMLSKD